MQELTPPRRVRRPRRNSPQGGLVRDLTEGEVAIELVARGAARRVALHNLRNAARIAPQLAEIAATAGVEFRIDDDHVGPPSIVVGPRTARLDDGA
jgi:hypothetical protein